ncbi:MAG: WD40 repeat domain-containing protein, partial [Candidatus Rokuibacteriota bacterium]
TRQWNVSKIKRDKSVNALCVVGEHVFDIGDAGILRLDEVPISDNETLCNFLVAIDDAVLTGGQSGMLLDAKSATSLFRYRSPLNCAAVYEHGAHTRLVVGTYTGELLFFAVERHDGQLTVHPVSSQKPHANAIKGVAVAHGMVFSCCADGSAAWNRAEDFGIVHRVSPGHTSIANGCAATPSGFASVGRDLKLRFWTNTFEQRCIDTPHRNSIRCIAASVSGRYLATGGYRGVIAIYDVVEDAWVHTFRATSFGISCVVADQARDGFIASSYDGLTHRFHADPHP